MMTLRLIDSVRAGSRVTIVDRFGKHRSGRAVMPCSAGGWVLNMGGRYGTPGIADDSNTVKVRAPKEAKPPPAPLKPATVEALQRLQYPYDPEEDCA